VIESLIVIGPIQKHTCKGNLSGGQYQSF